MLRRSAARTRPEAPRPPPISPAPRRTATAALNRLTSPSPLSLCSMYRTCGCCVSVTGAADATVQTATRSEADSALRLGVHQCHQELLGVDVLRRSRDLCSQPLLQSVCEDATGLWIERGAPLQEAPRGRQLISAHSAHVPA